MNPSNRNEIEMMKKDIESDGEEGGETGKPQQQKFEKLEAKATGEISNNLNTAIIIVQLLEVQIRKMETLETRIRAATAEALIGKRMET